MKKLECEAPMCDQAETKLPPPTGSFVLAAFYYRQTVFFLCCKTVHHDAWRRLPMSWSHSSEQRVGIVKGLSMNSCSQSHEDLLQKVQEMAQSLSELHDLRRRVREVESAPQEAAKIIQFST